MKKIAAIAAFFLILCAGVNAASALVLSGSDILKLFTQDILTGISTGTGSPLAACPGTATLTYGGGGSGAGESALVGGTQKIAPMSRFLRKESFADLEGSVCDPAAPGYGPTTSLGLVVALDSATVVANDAEASGCGSLTGLFSASSADRTLAVNTALPGTCAGCTGSNYVFTDWKDVLAVLFLGRHHDTSGMSGAGAKECGSQVRRTLAANYHKIFNKSGADCSTGTCSALRHIYRLDDLSGATETFLGTVLNMGATDFCNGSDLQDNDPIKIACTPNKGSLGAGAEDVCDKDGNLGLLLPITQPESSTQTYNVDACEDGKFAFFPLPLTATTCPNGSLPQSGKCLTPTRTNGQPCLAEHFQTPPVGPAVDPRVYNTILRNTNGTVVLDNHMRQMTAAYYRIHSRHVMPTIAPHPAGSVCRQTSPILQIGCIAAIASPCSIALAGRETVTVIAHTSPLAVNGLSPDLPQIRAILGDPTSVLDTTYKLATRYYLNSTKGFNAGSAAEIAMTSCWSTRRIVDAAAQNAGLLTLDDSGTLPVQCRDFKETDPRLGCGVLGAEHDACADPRPAPLP